MPELGTPVSPVGAPARRASEPPTMRTEGGAGRAFGRTVSRNPTPPDRLSTSLRVQSADRRERNAGLDAVSRGSAGPGRRARPTKKSTEWSMRPDVRRSGRHDLPGRRCRRPQRRGRGDLRPTTHSGRRRCRCGRHRGCAIAACGGSPCLRNNWESRPARVPRRKLNEAPRRKGRTVGESTITPTPRRSRHPGSRCTITQRSSPPSHTKRGCRPATADWIVSAATW